jgi:hypothetical protein
MALVLLGVEAFILLGAMDVWHTWGGPRGADNDSALGAGGDEKGCPAALMEGGIAAGPFAGLGKWMGAKQQEMALWGRYQAVVDEFEGYLEERERAGGGAKAKGWTLLSARWASGRLGSWRLIYDLSDRMCVTTPTTLLLTIYTKNHPPRRRSSTHAYSKDGRLRVSLRWPDPSNPGQGAPMLIAEGLYYNTTALELFEAMRVRKWVSLVGRPDMNCFCVCE